MMLAVSFGLMVILLLCFVSAGFASNFVGKITGRAVDEGFDVDMPSRGDTSYTKGIDPNGPPVSVYLVPSLTQLGIGDTLYFDVILTNNKDQISNTFSGWYAVWEMPSNKLVYLSKEYKGLELKPLQSITYEKLSLYVPNNEKYYGDYKLEAGVGNSLSSLFSRNNFLFSVVGEVSTHKECSGNACIDVEGVGVDECSFDLECVSNQTITHKECSGNACIDVPGAGINTCTSSLDCITSQCEDSDGGFEYFVKGTCSDESVHEERCILITNETIGSEVTFLEEWNCRDLTCVKTLIDCSIFGFDYICEEGACIVGPLAMMSPLEVGFSCDKIGVREEGRYCSLDGIFEEQKEGYSICQSNFECKTNVCDLGLCTRQGVFVRVADWFTDLFG
jgi:hypothetical protein